MLENVEYDTKKSNTNEVSFVSCGSELKQYIARWKMHGSKHFAYYIIHMIINHIIYYILNTVCSGIILINCDEINFMRIYY